ncbi:MAG: ABC-F family ATP-binding cassette domain-containing protein [Candidatus Riflebacteria bacterium]|nr:ABC-F family ATP-binding cassette domain-containing protein [Candidatus Riflebacteria bacterium]
MNILSVEALGKSYGAGPVLDGVTFGLEHDERMGIIGRNGSGKTTLLRILAGVETSDQGRVSLANGRLLSFLPQNPVLASDLSVLDAIFAQGSDQMCLLRDYQNACHELHTAQDGDERAMDKVTHLAHQIDIAGAWDLEARAKSILSRLGIVDISARIGSLSGGQRKRVALARCLILRPDLLLLDEPTNHLDADTIIWLEEYLSRFAGALLLVTHDRFFLERVTNRMLEVERGQVQRFEGNYSYYLEKKQEQTLQRDEAATKRENLIRRELTWLRRGARARSTKQKAHVERVKTLLASQGDGPARKIELSGGATRLGNKILEMHGISKTYSGRTVIDNFSYNLKSGDRVGLIGPNGAGKTTLLEIISGRIKPDSGRVEIGSTAVIGYYDQESRALADELRIIDYIREAADFVRTADGTSIPAGQMLERFLFVPALHYTPVARLSGGERRRLYLLRLLMSAPNVLLLDEPTNDFDIPTLLALEEYLENFPGCLIVASHDRSFLDHTIEHLFHFGPGGAIRGYPGNYSTYLEIREQEETKISADATSPARGNVRDVPVKGISGIVSEGNAVSGGASAPVDAVPRRLNFKERRELEELETRIASAEARKAEIEAILSSPPSDMVVDSSLYSELPTLIAQLDRDMERWAELADRV